MRKVPKRVPHPWSEDMEEALIAQHEAMKRQPEAVPSKRRSWRGGVRALLILCAFVVFFPIWCAAVISSNSLR